MPIRPLLPVATLVLALALLFGAPAAAAEQESKANGFDAFFLKGSNGYRIFVFALFRPGYGESSDVLVTVSREGQGASYFAPGVVTDKKVEADLGELGEIDVTFRPSGERGMVSRACAPSKVPYEKGTYVGTIEFRGEEGYTQVSAERARFSPFVLAGIGCPYTVTDEVFGRDLPGARLLARAKLGQRQLEVRAHQNRPGRRVRIQAALEERRGRISIGRLVTFAAPANAFHFAPDLRTAALDPPAPFSGTGFFRRDAKPAGRWTGNLSVDFPGRSDVPLTGERFHVNLRHSRLVEETISPSRLNLSAWPSTKPSPTASATSSPLGPS